MNEYINLTLENIDKEHICCAIGDPKHQNGVESKKEWIKNKLKDGQVFLRNYQFQYLDAYIERRIEEMKAKHPSVGDVRYIGLFPAVELVKDKETREALVPYGRDPEGIMGKIVGMLKEKGFNTYSHEACIFVCPPLIITEEELKENLAILDEVLTEVDKMI